MDLWVSGNTLPVPGLRCAVHRKYSGEMSGSTARRTDESPLSLGPVKGSRRERAMVTSEGSCAYVQGNPFVAGFPGRRMHTPGRSPLGLRGKSVTRGSDTRLSPHPEPGTGRPKTSNDSLRRTTEGQRQARRHYFVVRTGAGSPVPGVVLHSSTTVGPRNN